MGYIWWFFRWLVSRLREWRVEGEVVGGLLAAPPVLHVLALWALLTPEPAFPGPALPAQLAPVHPLCFHRWRDGEWVLLWLLTEDPRVSPPAVGLCGH